MSKRSTADLLRDRSKKQKNGIIGSAAKHSTDPRAPPKPRTPAGRKNAMFEESVNSQDAEKTFPTAMDWGRLMVKCFWQHFAKFDPLQNIGAVLQREEPSFADGVLRFLKKNNEKRFYPGANSKAVEKEVVAYRRARREELHQQKRDELRSRPCEVERSVQRSRLDQVLPVVSETENSPVVALPERSVIGKERNSFYAGAALEIGREADAARAAVDGVINKLTCGEVVFATTPTATASATVGSYRHDRHGPWAHAGDGSGWADVFVPSLDRIAQRNIPVGGRAPLFFPTQKIAEGVDPMNVVKIGEGKYSQIFAPSNMLSTDKRVDLTGWPPMLVRVDKNGVCRSKNVVIRIPRLNSDDRATNDGSIAHAHEEATNICVAAFAGFGPSLLAAFFLPDPDPPSLDDHPRHAFRFVAVMKRQSASLEQRIRTPALAALRSSPLCTIGISRPARLSIHTVRYLTMLFDTVFEYSARGTVYLDAARGNFMDEEAAFRTNPNAEDVGAVDKVNVIDLDPRFYRRLDGAPLESIWLCNISILLAHMRRVDMKQNLIPPMLQMTLRGGMRLGELLCKVYREQQSNPESAWLFSIPWDEIPPQWQPDVESEWKTVIGSQLQQIIGYYFFYAERNGNGCGALQTFDQARYGQSQQAIDSARDRFHSSYISGGGMYTARHFLYATKDKTVTSLIYALLMYVDAKTIFKRPELLGNEPYAQPAPLPRMREPLGAVDSHLGLNMRRKICYR